MSAGQFTNCRKTGW